MNDPGSTQGKTDADKAAEASADALDLSDMERLVGGHDTALNELMARHGPKLFAFLIRSLQNEEDAADLAQETFVRVYQNRARFDPKQRFTTWIYTIAANLVKDRYRWRSRHPQISLDAESKDSGHDPMRDQLPGSERPPGEMLADEERAETIRRAIARLPEDLRTPLLLAEYDDKSQAEIAAILNCSVKTIETRIYRARQRLRKDLAALLPRE